jgi:NADPH:quinone reductase-like Zn-dependent oxidoreductase
MRAIIQDGYGSGDVLGLREIERPEAGKGEVLVRVHAAALHVGDWLLVAGRPSFMRLGWGFRRPRKRIPGFDLAGVVEEVGDGVAEFRPGDEVFGTAKGTCAEHAVVPAGTLVLRPAALTREEAATLPTSGVTALRSVRDEGGVESGHRVLVNGASGGVGTFAVQIAKALGAEVAGVCSAANAELVRSLGADHVIDYTQEDFTEGEARYDLILDNAGSHPLGAMRRVLTPNGRLLPNNGTAGGSVFGPLGRMAAAAFVSLFDRRQGRPYVVIPRKQDLLDMAELVGSGDVKPVIGRRFPLEDTGAAIDLLGGGHSTGKIVVTT